LQVVFFSFFQYDPIYPKSTIEAAGIAQSVLYELLYEKVCTPLLRCHAHLHYIAAVPRPFADENHVRGNYRPKGN
jgi:hypothetical protein